MGNVNAHLHTPRVLFPFVAMKSDKTERIHGKFTQIIKQLPHLQYEDRITTINLFFFREPSYLTKSD